jgi:cell wall-associated NlpC family hydrolase
LDGSLKDWYIAGCRQLKSETSYAFELVTVKGKDGITRIASDYKLPVDFLYEINGYGSSPKISSGDRLLVLSKKQLQPKGPQTTPGPLYETKAGDTLDALAAKWHSTVDDVLSLNSDVLPGQDLDPGSILTEPGGSPETGITVKQEFGDIKDPTYLFKTSNSTQGAVPLEPNTPVVVQCEVPPNFYQVMVVKTGAKGYVVRVHVSLRDQPKRTGTTQLENAVKTEALSHLGTRYLWGGHDLVHGIDCSHYVAAVLSRSVLTPQATPSPPVFLQEQKGLIVHWKATFALRGSSQFVPPAPRPPSANELRPGDRIILQWDPVNGRVGGRHTGIFVGAYGKIKYGVANATCSHGVAVTDLFRPYFWKGYRYALRDFKH